MENNHTPGPWTVKHAGTVDEIWSNRGLLATLSLYPQGSKVTAANAQVMALAPVLIENLITTINVLEKVVAIATCQIEEMRQLCFEMNIKVAQGTGDIRAGGSHE